MPHLEPDIEYEEPDEKTIKDLKPSKNGKTVESVTSRSKINLNHNKSVKGMKNIKSRSKTGLGSSKSIKSIENLSHDDKDLINSEKVKSAKSLTNKKNLKSPNRSSPYNEPNEVYNKFCFKTEPKEWGNVIEFAPVNISSPRENVAEIRDTFKTCVTVRIVYLKVRKYNYFYFTNFPMSFLVKYLPIF